MTLINRQIDVIKEQPKKLVALILSTAFCWLTACSLQAEVILPTVAVLPSVSIQPTTLDNTIATAAPTFTLVPAINQIDAQMTAHFADKAGLATRLTSHLNAIYTLGANQTQVASSSTQQWHTEIDLSYLDLESNVIYRTMPINDGKTISSHISIAGDKEYLKLFYRYKSDILPFDDGKQRIPYLLCGLRDAGLENLTVSINIRFESSIGNYQGGSYVCVDAKTIGQLNCADPGRVNANKIRSTSSACKY